jgi:hypothetical protein
MSIILENGLETQAAKFAGAALCKPACPSEVRHYLGGDNAGCNRVTPRNFTKTLQVHEPDAGMPGL